MAVGKPKVTFIGEQEVELPIIKFTKYAMKWIAAIVEKHTEEVGFYGVVDREGMTFTISDVFYPKHELVTATTCEIDPEGMQQIMMHLLDKGREDDIAKLKMWGHSHVNMGVSPSGQDETQAMELVNDNQDYLIRLIANKKGELGITMFDLERNMKISDLGYTVVKEANEDQLQLDDVRACFDLAESPEIILEMVRSVSAVKDLRDDEYTLIATRVEEMKKTNLPPKTTYTGGTYGSYNRGSWNQHTKRYDPPAKTTSVGSNNLTVAASNAAKTSKTSVATAAEKQSIKAASGFSEEELQDMDADFAELGVNRTSHHSMDDYYNDLYGDVLP